MSDGGLLDTILNNFQSAISGAWGPSLSAYLLPLLLALVTLQFGLIAMEAAIARDFPLVLMHILLGIIRVSIVVAIFQHSFDWGNAIVDTGQDIGIAIGGLAPSAMTPSGVFNTGLSMSQTIFAAKASGGWLQEIFQDIEFIICGLAVTFAWCIAALLYLGCLLEATALVYLGPLLIAFTPLSWTFDMLITWGKFLLRITFKIAIILATLAVGMALATEWVTATTANATTFTTDIWNLLVAVVESAVFVWFTWKLPNTISGLTGGAALLGFGEAVVAMGAQAAGHSVSGATGSGGGSQASTGSAQGGALISSEGWAGQAVQAAANAGRALAQKVQAALTK
jgi:P-type conjugative transfer protein TrbL